MATEGLLFFNGRRYAQYARCSRSVGLGSHSKTCSSDEQEDSQFIQVAGLAGICWSDRRCCRIHSSSLQECMFDRFAAINQHWTGHPALSPLSPQQRCSVDSFVAPAAFESSKGLPKNCWCMAIHADHGSKKRFWMLSVKDEECSPQTKYTNRSEWVCVYVLCLFVTPGVPSGSLPMIPQVSSSFRPDGVGSLRRLHGDLAKFPTPGCAFPI